MQKKLIPLFHYSLNPGGFLFLGSAESIVNYAELFKPFDHRSRLYRRLQPLFQAEPVKSPISFAPVQSTANQTPEMVRNIQPLIDKLILQYYSPAAVLVNYKGDILYINGPTDKYLEPAADNNKWNVLAAAREGLKFKLSNVFDKVLRQKETVTLKNTVVINQNESRIVDILINPLKRPKALRGMIMIVFTDVITPDVVEKNTTGRMPVGSQKETELERELMLTRQMWQAASTEMQISKEELESNNEELQATNEELQSINEELTTTKEEALLSNEELKLANFELQAKLDGLSLVAENIKNQMDSMNIAALFLDNTLCVKHFTKPMSVISRLIPSDVGRPFTDVASDLIYPELEDDVHEVLRTLIIAERQVLSSNGCWFNAHIQPYRTLEDKTPGVVITFINITEFKVLRS
jgi:two-component system CheB/CheR fusion protein